MLHKLVPAASAIVLTATGFAFAEVGAPDPPAEETTATVASDGGVTTTTLADGSVTTTTVTADGATTTTLGTDDGTGVERSYEGCGDFTEGNHGKYVSGIAKTKPHAPGAVPEAAHSNCGKPAGSVEGDDDEDADEDADEATTETTLGDEGDEGDEGDVEATPVDDASPGKGKGRGPR